MHKSITVVLILAASLAASNTLAQQPATSPPPAAPSTRAEIEAEMRALQERLAVLSREYATLSGAVPFSNAGSLDDLLQDVQNIGDIESTERGLRELEAQLAQLRQRYTENHPAAMLLERQIEALRSRLAALRAAETAGRSPDSYRPPLLDRLEEEVSQATAAAWREERRARLDETAQAQRQSARELDAASRSAGGYAELFARAYSQRALRYSTTVWDTMQLVTLTPQLGEYFGTESGILVLRAPADESLGLRDGDVILDIGGRTPTSPEHTLRILSSFVPGETLRLAIMRNGRRETHEIVLPQDDSETLERSETPAAMPPSRAQPPQALQPPQPSQPSQRPQQRQPAQEQAAPADADGAIR